MHQPCRMRRLGDGGAAALTVMLVVSAGLAQGDTTEPASDTEAPSSADEPAPSELEAISDADKQTAKALVASGDAKFQAADYAGALRDYQGADAIMRVPTTTVEVAKALVALDRLIDGRQAYGRVMAYPVRSDEPGAFQAARRNAERALRELENRIP